MKVLLINGSPNAKGCTYTALEEVSKTLNQEGIETEILQIGKESIRGCIACQGCRKKGSCVFEDAVNEAAAKFAAADGLVVGSPVYYASANGTLISFMDRLFYTGGQFLAHKPAAAVASARRAGTTATLDEIQKYFTINQMPIVSSTYWNMVHGGNGRGQEAAQDLEGMQTMRNLGKNMAWLLRCIEAGKAAGIMPPEPDRGARTDFIR